MFQTSSGVRFPEKPLQAFVPSLRPGDTLEHALRKKEEDTPQQELDATYESLAARHRAYQATPSQRVRRVQDGIADGSLSTGQPHIDQCIRVIVVGPGTGQVAVVVSLMDNEH